MPKYTYHLKNGKTLTLEGAEQPSDADVEDAAKGAGVELQLADDANEPGKPAGGAQDASSDAKPGETAPTGEKVAPAASNTVRPAITPGIMATTGAALTQAGGFVRPAAKAVGEFVAHSPIAQRAAGIAAGTGAFGLSSAVGAPPILSGPASMLAYQAGRRTAGKAGAALAKAASVPEITAPAAAKIAQIAARLGINPEALASSAAAFEGAAGATMGGRALSFLGKRLIPGAGYALTAADAVNYLNSKYKKKPGTVTPAMAPADSLEQEMITRALPGG